ncbi:MAG: AMP-binding protein [Halioglobus sp.]|nr:AMP-binding protein [Halioglobus sp.]
MTHTLYALNLCRCRYLFTLGFTAALAGGKVNLLPANRQPQTVASVLQQYRNTIVLHDQPLDEEVEAVLDDQGVRAIDLSRLSPETKQTTLAEAVPGDRVAAIVFTSGTTGQPHAIAKPWHTLVGVTGLLRQRFLGQAGASIVATVPPQHMYGLETSVMMALHGQCLVSARQPLYPMDVRNALEEVPAPRFLVTTPLHLSALLRAKLPLPPLHTVISATAPLATKLAEDVEKAWGCRVTEIFGCSEAGSLASRNTVESEVWQTLEGVELKELGTNVSVTATHFRDSVILQDRLEVLSPDRFRFIARSADMVNIAGKRASLAELTAQLLAVEGVEDGVFFLREDSGRDSERRSETNSETKVQRLAALVVSTHDEMAIARSLARCIDPVFMPRPLKRVARIPRNDLGKVPRSSLIRMLRQGDHCEC